MKTSSKMDRFIYRFLNQNKHAIACYASNSCSFTSFIK